MSCPWNPLDCPGQLAKSAAGGAFDFIADRFGELADAAINWLWRQISLATAVDLDGRGFNNQLAIVLALTAVVAVGLFAIQLVVAVMRRDMGSLARGLKGVVVAFIGGGAAIGATNALLAATDSLSEGIVKAATGGTVEQMGHSLLAAGSIQGSTANAAGVLLLSLFAIVATIAVWASLMVRKVLIVISAVFAPIAFAGSIADVTVSWTRRWIETTVALIVSKLVLVIIFMVGLGMLVDGAGQSGGGATQTMTQIVSGLLVLLVAGAAPFLALGLVHWSGNQFHQVHSLASTSTAGALRTADWSRSAARKASVVAAGAAGAAGGAGGFRMIGSSWPRPGAGQTSAPTTVGTAVPAEDRPAPAPPRRTSPPPPPPRADSAGDPPPEPPPPRRRGPAAGGPERHRP